MSIESNRYLFQKQRHLGLSIVFSLDEFYLYVSGLA